MHFEKIPASEIILLGNSSEAALHKMLDGFLAKIDTQSDPKIFKLIGQVKESLDKENLPALAQRIINGQPSGMDKFIGFFSKKALAKSIDNAWSETKALVKGKTKTLVDVLNSMEYELKTEQNKLFQDIQSLEKMQVSYSQSYDNFVIDTVLLNTFLERSKAYVLEQENTIDRSNPIQVAHLKELKTKLLILESRVLAIEGVLTKLPADQLVISQLQDAAITTLQETVTTCSSRFGDIKSTLLSISAALTTKSVQQLSDSSLNMSNNLAQVRGILLKDVSVKAIDMIGENRLAQAKQIQDIIVQNADLDKLLYEHKAKNVLVFNEVRTIYDEARQSMLSLSNQSNF